MNVNIPPKIISLMKYAKSQITLDYPFFAMILLKLDIKYTNELETMGTNGIKLFINPMFILTISKKELIGVLVHEIFHIIFLHMTRRNERDHRKFNIACDYAINPLVLESGLVLPSGVLIDPAYKGLSAEKIYDLLPDDATSPDMDDLIYNDNMDQTTKKKTEREIKNIVTQATTAVGDNIPDCIKQYINEVNIQKVCWKTKLKIFMQATLGGEDSTWRRPNKNYLYTGMYLPTSEGAQTPNLAILLDTSGSIYSHKELFDEFCSEVRSIVQETIPEQIDIYYVDTSIKKHDTFYEGEQPEFELIGGGGTNFKSAFEEMEKHAPACIIAFTDLYAVLPSNSSIPTMWIVYGNDNPTPPFGETTIIGD